MKNKTPTEILTGFNNEFQRKVMNVQKRDYDKGYEDGKNENIKDLESIQEGKAAFFEQIRLNERIRIKALIEKKIKYWARLYRQYGTEQTALVVRVLREILKELEEEKDGNKN